MKAIEMERKAAADHQQHRAKVAETIVGMAATAAAHDQKMEHNDASHAAKLEQMRAKPEKPNG